MNGLKRLCQLVVFATLPGLLSACAGLATGGMSLSDAARYPMRSPEYVLRDLGGERYLLAQWDVPMNGNVVQRVRYYDRSTGMLAHLPEAVTVFREGYVNNILGALRYESDSPLQIAFFTRRETGYNPYCAEDKPQRLCGYMDIVLSLDGGRSFDWRRVNIPASMRGITPRSYEFVIVRNNTIYFGMYADSRPEVCCHSSDANMVDKRGVAQVRRFRGAAVADTSDVFLSVLAMPLASHDGKPLPAEQIVPDLSANLLIGPALLAFDLGQPMPPLATPPAAQPAPPTAHYKRADRAAYIDSLRSAHPVWAAHQTLNDIPQRQKWMSSSDLNALRERQAVRGDDPVEWVKFESPAPK